MKNLFLTILAVCFIAFNSLGQSKNIVRLSPMSFIKNKAKFHYERGGLGTEKLGVGAQLSGFFGEFKGVRLAPYGRYYILGENGEGMFAQLKFHFSYNSFDYTNYNETTSSSSLTEFGTGVGFGYQFLFGSNDNFALDLWAGYRFSSLNLENLVLFSDTGYANEAAYNQARIDDMKLAYRILHSNMFDMGISLGYAF